MSPEAKKQLEEIAGRLVWGSGERSEFMKIADAAWGLAIKTERERCAELLQGYKELGFTPNVDVIMNDILNPEGG